MTQMLIVFFVDLTELTFIFGFMRYKIKLHTNFKKNPISFGNLAHYGNTMAFFTMT